MTDKEYLRFNFTQQVNFEARIDYLNEEILKAIKQDYLKSKEIKENGN